MSNEPKNQTAYADFLYAQVDAYFASGGAGFTLKELSEFSGLKVTGNMRRRINHAVATGKLIVMPAWVEPKGSCNVFMLPITSEMGELPF